MFIISLITTFLLGATQAQREPLAAPTISPTSIVEYFFNDTDLTDCGNGVCDAGENCLSCAVDCISGTSGGFECGNGVCEDGETCYTCPNDCMSSEQMTGGGDKFCCYGGETHPRIANAVSCHDFRCSTDKVTCDSEESPLVTYCCGDGVCSGEETYLNCGIDNCVELCGNGVCDVDEGENADTCATDCTCNLDGICDPWETVNSCSLDCTCGDRVCNYDLGETVANCMTDCACNANYVCEAWEDAKHCPRDCGDTAAYGNGEGHAADNGYDGTDQQFDGSYGHAYDSMNMNGYGYDSMNMNGYGYDSMGMNGGEYDAMGMNGGEYDALGMNGAGNDDYGTCKDNEQECSDNLECCSSACDTYDERGPSKCVG